MLKVSFVCSDELKSSERLEKINLASNAFINILTAVSS